MRLQYDKYNRVEPSRIYLGDLENHKVCCLNGIKPETVSLNVKLNNTYSLSFTVDKMISYFGKQYESNGYNWLGNLSRIYVENVGWFVMSQPTIENDGVCETKNITAESIDIEFTQRDLIGFKINCGTTDSYEMLIPENVEKNEYTGVEFAKEQIKFYNPDNSELSMLDILLKESGMTDWSVGYVDTIAKKYNHYVDGQLVETEVLLKDEIPYFDISSKSIYGIFTQDIEQYFECIILFNIDKKQINAYRVENVGKDTNVHIGFRNLQNTNNISVDEGSIYTRYNVRGNDDLTINYVNFGLDKIENIEYFLNTKYLPERLISKYKLWLSDVESKRYDYTDLSRKYNNQLEVISELKNRVPLDATSTDWDSFSLEELNNKKSDYEAQKLAIEKMFTDEEGNVDFNKLQQSDLAADYNQIVDVIIPNIEIAIWNKDIVTEDDKREAIEDKDWSHYGLDELYAKLQLYEGQKSTLTKSGYNVPWTEDSNHAQDYHEARYEDYKKLCNELNPERDGSCAKAYEERKQEVEDAEYLRDQYQEERLKIAESVYKESWKYIDENGEEITFSLNDLSLLNKLYCDTDYVNNNMFLVSSDTQVTAIDEQQKLYDAATNDLSATSQPQFKYSTTLDNFLAIAQYSDFSKEIDVGNYIRLDIRDDYQVKLRVVSIEYNPMIFDNDLNIEFSNMVKSKSKRTDMDALLNSSSSTGKNQISGSSNGSSANIDDTTMRAILNKLINSSALTNKINNSTSISSTGGSGTISNSELETKLKKLIDLDTGDGFFNYLQTQLISTGKIVSDSGVFKDLSALVANIDKLLAGEVSAELGHIISLTSENVKINEAVIRELIAAQITVSMLKAGDISTDSFHIVSDDGGIEIVGNTMQFKDSNNVVRIQIGRDTENNFTFCLYDETGEGVLIDSTGIHDSAISDGLIKNNMIADGEISKDKLGFYIAEANEDGTINIGQIKADGESFEVVYNKFKEDVGTQISGIESKVDANTKSITDKVWQTDITESINNYNNTTIQGIRDSVSQHTTSIDGITSKVSDIETYTGINEEGKLDTSLTERISIVEQTAKGISQTVSETYATKDEVNGLIEESYTATIDHIANEINSSVIDNITGENSYVNQKTESIEQGIKNKIGKEQFDIVKLRYIRDWLYSNDKDSENRYVECKVFDEKGENIALGIIPKAYDSFLSEITTISNLNLYTDNIIDDTNYIYSENLSMLQLDLGKVYENIDKIDVWHYYSDGRSYSHKLDISEDGEKWITLFDSQTDGKYVETNAGKDNKVQTESIIEQISFIRQTLDSYVVKMQNNEDNYSKFQALVNEIRQEVQSTKDGITTISQQIQNSDGWKVMLKSIGAYTGDDADEIEVENYVALSLKPEGVAVTSNEKQGNTLLMKADGMFGYYNDGLSTENEGKGDEIFWVKGDTTYTQRSIVPKGIDFKTMKEIPMNYNGYNGLVFVKGGGDA